MGAAIGAATGVGTMFAACQRPEAPTMKLSATVTTHQLQTLAQSLIPLRADLRLGDDAPRWLDVDELFEAEMVPDQGLSLAARAAIRWPERALFDEFRVERIGLLLGLQLDPSDDGVALVVNIRFEALDVNWVPDFVSEAVLNAINKRLERAGIELKWDLSGTLTFGFEEPGKTNVDRICFGFPAAQLEITADGLHLEGELTVDVQRSSPEELAQQLQEQELQEQELQE